MYVTILILIDGFLQYFKIANNKIIGICHNPYFNRWFSAIFLGGAIYFVSKGSQSLF